MSCATMGIDPGTRGGLAVLRRDGSVEYVQSFYPEMTEGELVAAAKQGLAILVKLGGYQVFIEKVGYIGKRSGNEKGDGGQGAFTFGRVDGLLRGAIIASGGRLRDVYPQAWQSRLRCLSGGNKNVTKAKAAELWPTMKMTHAIADALLIAEYGRQVSGWNAPEHPANEP